MESPTPATSLLESKGGSSANASQSEEKVKLDKSECNEIKSEAAKKNVDMTGGEDDGGGDNLALRGHRESLQLDNDSDVGNFVGLLKLLAIFDPFMKEHLTRAESHPGFTFYLSPGVQNEFIHMMASTVSQSLLRRIHKANYYGLMFDSTPDQAHREQMSEVVRNMEADFERKTVRVRESFLGCTQIRQKDAESLVEDILKELEKDEMELEDCQSQCYDNAAMMAGHRRFWNKVLIRIDRIQKRLQDPSMNFHEGALDWKTLRDHFDDEREVLVSESLKEGLGLCQEWNIEVERHQRRKKQMTDENSRNARLTAKEEMERVMKGTLDRLHREMDDTDSKFGFLLDVEGLCYGADSNDLKKKCENLGELYSSDVEGQQLYEEILDCRMLLSSRANMKISRLEELLESIVQYGDESVFPNLHIAIQIMLTIAVSIDSCERSFSKLKLILSNLRASMGQGRLCDLALLSVEREETKKN
ncbi:uncharacterized protein LOC106463354 [Limulus polyphemus]|uniref:Uncharacterized protein LOC106463354 n=1 Tax=Limulus polyphemus TaxID=6850 RepID=A0ABM1BBT7_LIMPO|nr:uncharacterized protein LOC106463354 [Limulus polyphemus]